MELKEYMTPLRRWWWLLLASTMVATVSSLIAVIRQPPLYWAGATLMVGSALTNPNPTGDDFYLTQQLASTYVDLAKRRIVQDAAEEQLGLTQLPEYTVRPVPNTQLIEIAVTDTSPERAQAVANELARQLVLRSPSNQSAAEQERQVFINQQLAALEQDIQRTEGERDAKQAELGSLFSARQIADTEAQIAALDSKLTNLQSNYAALLTNTLTGAINAIHIVEPAALPTETLGAGKRMTVLTAALIGFMLAAGAAYLLEYLDNSLKTPDEVRQALGLVTLGAVPSIEEQADPLVIATQPKGAAAEAYRILRTNFQFAALEKRPYVLLITSPLPGEGKSQTVANLAIALAQVGQRVVIVDADLHRPKQHRLFKLPNKVGLTSVLLGEAPERASYLHDTSIAGLSLLPSGILPPNPAELLSMRHLETLLARLRQDNDIVIVDSPPCLMLGDATVLSTKSDGVLLVLDAQRTGRDSAKKAVAVLQQVKANVIGILLNRIPVADSSYYYYYQSGYYSEGEPGNRDGGMSGSAPAVSPQREKKHQGASLFRRLS